MSGLTFLFFKQRLLDAIIYKATYFKVGLQSGAISKRIGCRIAKQFGSLFISPSNRPEHPKRGCRCATSWWGT